LTIDARPSTAAFAAAGPATLQHHSLPFDNADEVAGVAARIFEQFPADRSPTWPS
jgi:hypothetical protein